MPGNKRDRTMSIPATGSTPRPTTTVAASASEHATMRLVLRSGVQLGTARPPGCVEYRHPQLLRACGLASTSLLGNVVLACVAESGRERTPASNGRG